MCVGETLDTLDQADQAVLRTIADATLPTHRLGFHSNADGMTWALLTPERPRTALPKATICRIHPAIVVMLEDAQDRRQFRSVARIEDAVDYVQSISNEALLAAAGLSEQPCRMH